MESIFSVYEASRDRIFFMNGSLRGCQGRRLKILRFLSEFDLNVLKNKENNDIYAFWCETITSLAITEQCSNGKITKEEIFFLELILLNAFELAKHMDSIEPLLAVRGEKEPDFLFDFSLNNFPKAKLFKRIENPCFSINGKFEPCEYSKAIDFIFDFILRQNEISPDSKFYPILASEDMKTPTIEEFTAKGMLLESLQYIFMRKVFEKITGKEVPRNKLVHVDATKEGVTKEELVYATRYGYDDVYKFENSEEIDFSKHYNGIPNDLNQEVPCFIYDSLSKGIEINKEWLTDMFDKATAAIISENERINKDEMPRARIGLICQEIINIPKTENDLINYPEENRELRIALYTLLGLLVFDSFDTEKLAKTVNCAVCGKFRNIVCLMYPEINYIANFIAQDEISQLIVKTKDFSSLISYKNSIAVKKAFSFLLEKKDYSTILSMLSNSIVPGIVAGIPENEAEFIEIMLKGGNTSYTISLLDNIDHDEFIRIVAPFLLKYPRESSLITAFLSFDETQLLLSLAQIDDVSNDSVDTFKDIMSSLPYNIYEKDKVTHRTISTHWVEDGVINKEEKKEVQNHIYKKCSEPATEKGFWCFTCGITNDKCLCPYCAEVCHECHDLVPCINPSKTCSCDVKASHDSSKNIVDPNKIIPFIGKLSKAHYKNVSTQQKISMSAIEWSIMTTNVEEIDTTEESGMTCPIAGNDYEDAISSDIYIEDFFLRSSTSLFNVCVATNDNHYMLAVGSQIKILTPDFHLVNEADVGFFVVQLCKSQNPNIIVVSGTKDISIVLNKGAHEEMEIREVLSGVDDVIHEVQWSLSDPNCIIVALNSAIKIINTLDNKTIREFLFDDKQISSIEQFIYDSVHYLAFATIEGLVELINIPSNKGKDLGCFDDNQIISVCEGMLICCSSSSLIIMQIATAISSEAPLFMELNISDGPFKFIAFDEQTNLYLFQRPIDGAFITMSIDTQNFTSNFRIPPERCNELNLLENNMYNITLIPPLGNVKQYRGLSSDGSINAISNEKVAFRPLEVQDWLSYEVSKNIIVSSSVLGDSSRVINGNKLMIPAYELPCSINFTPKDDNEFIAGFVITFGNSGTGSIPSIIECEDKILKLDQQTRRSYSIGLTKITKGMKTIKIGHCPNNVIIDSVQVYVTREEKVIDRDPICKIIERLAASISEESAKKYPLSEETINLAISLVCSPNESEEERKRNEYVESCIRTIFNIYNISISSMIIEYIEKHGSQYKLSGPAIIEAAKRGKLSDSFWKSEMIDEDDAVIAAFMCD